MGESEPLLFAKIVDILKHLNSADVKLPYICEVCLCMWYIYCVTRKCGQKNWQTDYNRTPDNSE